jgi:histidine triad (HIT) family protein
MGPCPPLDEMVRAYLIHLVSRLFHFLKPMNSTCLFCKIVAGDAKASIVYQDDLVTAFRDIHPVAPTHILIVPNRHIESVNQADAADAQALGSLFLAAQKIAEMENIQQGGYRLIVNTGPHGGQTIFHLHMHLIGGQRMKHPMG